MGQMDDAGTGAPLSPPGVDPALSPETGSPIPVLCRRCAAVFSHGPEEEPPAACPECASPWLIVHPELDRLDIAHIDCDAFYASVEKRDDPSLIDKPLIVGHAGGRGVVTTACYIARQFGPRSAMPMFKAMELCPQAVVVPPDMAKYKRVSNQIRAIFRDATPIIEPVSLDEAYLDFSQDANPGGTLAAPALATIAVRVKSEVGITVSVGLAHNKFLAKLASDLDKPSGFSVIGRTETKSFLAPLVVGKINGVGAVTAGKLAAHGIETIGQLQDLSEMELISRYGKFGRRLAGYAQGKDKRKVTPDSESKSVSAETTFSKDINTVKALIDAVEPMCTRVAERLAKAGLAGGTVVLKLKTADFQTLTRNRKLPNPTGKADVIFGNARDLITREADGRFFRLIGVGVSDLCPATEADPPDLFSA